MTTFAASNIAWSFPNRVAAYGVLSDHGFEGLEIAPGLFFADESDPLVPSSEAISTRMAEIEKAGLRLVSMQSLLFNVPGAELFGSPAAVDALTVGLDRAIVLAGRLGITNLVFGSPRQRVIPTGMEPGAVTGRVRDVFRPLGDRAAAHGIVLAMETNPPAYGTNFMNDFDETLAVVRDIAHPAIRFNFDVGALQMTDGFSRIDDYARLAGDLIAHVHVSEPMLAPAPRDVGVAARVLAAMASVGYERAISIEMKAVPEDEVGRLALSVGRLRQAIDAGGGSGHG